MFLVNGKVRLHGLSRSFCGRFSSRNIYRSGNLLSINGPCGHPRGEAGTKFDRIILPSLSIVSPRSIAISELKRKSAWSGRMCALLPDSVCLWVFWKESRNFGCYWLLKSWWSFWFSDVQPWIVVVTFSVVSWWVLSIVKRWNSFDTQTTPAGNKCFCSCS